MTVRNVVTLVVVTAALSGFGCFLVAAAWLHRGPSGPPGPTGQAGPPADADVTAEAVGEAIEKDPDAIGEALSGHLDYDDIQENLDADPAPAPAPDPDDLSGDVDELSTEVDRLSSELDDLTEKLEDLCSDLSASATVGPDVTSC